MDGDTLMAAIYLKYVIRKIKMKSSLLSVLLVVFMILGIGFVQASTLSLNQSADSSYIGYISNISESLSEGGNSVTVSLVMEEGVLPYSSLELLVNTFQDNAWKQTMNQCMAVGPLNTYNATEANPQTFVFTNIVVPGSPDYKVTVIWRDGETCSGEVIDRMINGHYRVATYNSLSLGLMALLLALIGAHYINKWAHNGVKA